MKELDDILSGQGEALPAPETPPVETKPEPAEQEQDVQPEEADGKEADGKKPPIGAIRNAERERAAKRYTEQVADFERKLEETNAAWERRMAQLMERLTPPQQPQQAPDWFENPSEATRHELQQTVGPQFEQVHQVIMAQAKMIAGMKYGDDKVEIAEKAFIKALESRTLDPADYHKIVNAPNRYAAAAQWHARQQTLSEIGDDPAAYKERLRAEIMEEMKAQPSQQNGAAPPIMPSNLAGARNVGNRSGPAWTGPQTLGDIFKR